MVTLSLLIIMMITAVAVLLTLNVYRAFSAADNPDDRAYVASSKHLRFKHKKLRRIATALAYRSGLDPAELAGEAGITHYFKRAVNIRSPWGW